MLNHICKDVVKLLWINVSDKVPQFNQTKLDNAVVEDCPLFRSRLLHKLCIRQGVHLALLQH